MVSSARGILSILVLCYTTRSLHRRLSTPDPVAEVQTEIATETARQLILNGQFKEAEVELRTTLASQPACAECDFLLAYTLLREDKPTESLAVYTRAAQLRTPSAEDLKNVALDYVLLNDYGSADKWMSQSLKWNDRTLSLGTCLDASATVLVICPVRWNVFNMRLPWRREV